MEIKLLSEYFCHNKVGLPHVSSIQVELCRVQSGEDVSPDFRE